METTLEKSRTWNDDYMLDIPIIDEQHKKLFDIYDSLLEMINDQELSNRSKIRQLIIDLDDYVKFHFKTEENLFLKAGIKDIDEHIIEHRLFSEKVKEWIFAYNYKNPLLLKNIAGFIKTWLISHILGSDAEYKDELKSYLMRKEGLSE